MSSDDSPPKPNFPGRDDAHAFFEATPNVTQTADVVSDQPPCIPRQSYVNIISKQITTVIVDS